MPVDSPEALDRYSRQTRFPALGEAGPRAYAGTLLAEVVAPAAALTPEVSTGLPASGGALAVSAAPQRQAKADAATHTATRRDVFMRAPEKLSIQAREKYDSGRARVRRRTTWAVRGGWPVATSGKVN